MTSRTTRHRILIAEDEKALAVMVHTYLTRAGYAAHIVHTGTAALAYARAAEPDVIVLDLGLPGIDGIEVCRQVRASSGCYILMLTARGREEDRLAGLEAGADDYIVKPFSVRELVARVGAVLRRPRGRLPDAATRSIGALALDLSAFQAAVAGEPVDLTRTEFALLAALSAAPGRALSRRQLIDAVWDTAWVGDERIVDVHVGHLRAKLALAAGRPGSIETVRAVGYRMVAP